MAWQAGQSITADGLNQMVPRFAFKAATTSRASTTTATADPDLTLDLGADDLGDWAIEIFLNATGAALGAGDIKVGLSYSGTVGDGVWMGQGTDTAAITSLHGFGRSIDDLTQSFGVNGGNFSVVSINGSISPTTTGTLAVVWAQNTSSATATNLRVGSWMKLTRMDL